MKYRPSFYKWNVTELDADYVFFWDVHFQIHDSERGNQQFMFVGYSSDGVLLEVAVEMYPNGEDDWAFHARKAGAGAKRFWEDNQ